MFHPSVFDWTSPKPKATDNHKCRPQTKQIHRDKFEQIGNDTTIMERLNPIAMPSGSGKDGSCFSVDLDFPIAFLEKDLCNSFGGSDVHSVYFIGGFGRVGFVEMRSSQGC